MATGTAAKIAAARAAALAKKTKVFKPNDYIKGGTKVGTDYTAYANYNQGKPDFGKGYGPGTPYHEVTRRNTGRNYAGSLPKPPAHQGSATYHRPSYGAATGDSRASAIRRRLGWI